MDLRSGYPFWLVKNGFVHSFPSAHADLETEVIVLGGGITGALVAYMLSQAGIEAAVVDKRHVGMGSTCASTALLQYEIDTPLHKLIEFVGRPHAERSYQVCIEAIDLIDQICKQEGIEADFEYKSSLFYASIRKDLEVIEKEYVARKRMGIALEKLSSEEVMKTYGIKTSGALLSEKGAQIDPYLMAHGLLQVCKQRGMRILDNTDVALIQDKGKKIQLTTVDGKVITARKIVYATGYEALTMMEKPIARLHCTYAIVSEPLSPELFWKDACLIWETAHPYLYLRTTSDNRILVGGKDEPFYSPAKRDRLMKRKSQQLLHSFHKLFPDIPFYTDFAWCGTFAETKDGLPYIGQVKQFPNAYFALGFGGNGITFSTVAAQIITTAIQGKRHPDAKLFPFDRA